MDQKQFEELLSLVSEWSRPDPALYVERLGRERKPKGPRNKKEPDLESEPQDDITGLDPIIEDQGEEADPIDPRYEYSDFDSSRSPETYPIRIQKLHRQPETCGDCGRHCEQGRQTQSKVYKTDKFHWRTYCVTCKKYKNPYTGKFDVNPRGMVRVYTAWCRGAEIRPSTLENCCDLDDQ